MEIVSSDNNIQELKENRIMGSAPVLVNSQIKFDGKNNIVYFENPARIENSSIVFSGNNSILYISDTNKPLYLNLGLNHNNCLFIGKNNYFNGRLNASCSEEKQIFIGNDGLFSFGIWLRTADPHLIYSANTMKRINPSRSIYIGDCVWIGQDSLILKGSQIHSGSIIGGGTVLSSKKIPSNCSAAGNPCKVISENVFWQGNCVHLYTDEDTKRSETCTKTDTLFSYDDSCFISFDAVENLFSEKIPAIDKLDKIREFFSVHSHKNRFAFKR